MDEAFHASTCTTGAYTVYTATYGGESEDNTVTGEGAYGHSLTHVVYNAPTVDTEGNKEYWVCGVCGDYFADEAGTQAIADKASVVLPKLAQQEEDPTEPTTENHGVDTDTRISLWQWLINFIRKLLTMFTGSSSIC